MARNLLTDKEVRNAKPRAKDYRLRDGDGLYVLVASTGGKSFQYRYKIEGKGGTATLKAATTLAEAREQVEPLRKLVAAGNHPKVVKRLERAAKIASDATTFESVKNAWIEIESRRKKWSADYEFEVQQSLINHLSDLDELPISNITARITAPILHKVELAAPDMERKVDSRLHAIMAYAVEIGAIAVNPLPRRRRAKIERNHYPAITNIRELGEIMRKARAADPCKGIQRAHILLIFTAMRISEIVGARWEEFELDGIDVAGVDGRRVRRDMTPGDWSIPRERMKRKDPSRGPHVVPLPPVLLDQLREWRAADGEGAIYVCPAPRDPEQPITREAVEKFYRRTLDLAGKHGPHSWRSAFSTISRDAGKSGDAVEAQLDHVVGSKVSSAYDRAQRLELRRELMGWYEGTLIAARDGAAVMPIINPRRSAGTGTGHAE